MYNAFSYGYNKTLCLLQRFEVSDLNGFNQHYLDAISYIPRKGITSFRIVAYQGGSYSGSSYNPGEKVMEQEIPMSSLQYNSWNRFEIINPFIIDNTKELWIGVIASVDTCYFINQGNNTFVSQKGGIMGMYSGTYQENANFNFYSFNANIAMKGSVRKISGQLTKYELYKNGTYTCDISSSATSYNDYSVPANPCRYDLYAVWNNYCSTETSVMYFPTTSCLPSVTTNEVTQTSGTTATCGGNVIHTGNLSVTARGVCWSTSHNPTISNSKTPAGSGSGAFTCSMTGLTPGQTYYVRAYATNSQGTNYGEEQSITLYYVVPKTGSENYTVNNETIMVYDHAGPNANFEKNCNGTLTLYTGSANQHFEITGSYQLTNYMYSGGDFLDNLYIYDGNGTSGTLLGTGTRSGNFSPALSSASNYITIKFTSSNSSYSDQVNPGFQLNIKKINNTNPPTITTNNVTNITATSVTCGGNVTATGGASVTSRGVCWSTSQNPTTSNNTLPSGSGTGSFTKNITGLTPNTTYYVRAYATNSAGTSYGVQKGFTTPCNSLTVNVSGTTTINYGNSTTLTASGASSYEWTMGSSIIGTTASITVSPSATTTYTVIGTNSQGCTGTKDVTVTVTNVPATLPTVTTDAVVQASISTATCGGNVTHNGYASVTARGICWSTSHNPTISNNTIPAGSGEGTFSCTMTGLTAGTTYYVRAYATNSVGTSYGEEQSITMCVVVPKTGDESYTMTSNTIVVCDHGGPNNNYDNECNGTLTINAGCSGCTFEITGSYNIEPSEIYDGDEYVYDFLYIYDATDFSSPLAYLYGSGNISTPIICPHGSLLLAFYADNMVNYPGFQLTIRRIGSESAPTVNTNNVTNIGTTTATCGGNVTADGGASVTARGVCWSTSPNPTVGGSGCYSSGNSCGSGTGAFSYNITNLNPNTTYYVRAYATNTIGTSYGEQKTLTTLCDVVDLTISGNTTIDYGSSTTLTASGAVSYEWKSGSTIIGTNASVTVNPTSTTTYTVTGTNNYGCTGSQNVTVTVNSLAPTVNTNNVTNIGTTTATCGGNVTADGGASVSARGVCWSTSENPTVGGSGSYKTTDGNGTGSFTSSITGLNPNTTYYVRASAIVDRGVTRNIDRYAVA